MVGALLRSPNVFSVECTLGIPRHTPTLQQPNNPHDPIGQVPDVLQRTTYQHTDRETFVRCINPTHYKEYSRNILLNNNE